MRRASLLVVWAVVGIGVCLASGPLAQADKNKTQDKNTQVDDKTFAQKAGAANLAEANLGQLAARLGSSPQVKQLGQHMAMDHLKANERLNMILGKENIPAATEMDQKHATLWKKLAGMSGADFDREYLQSMLKDHKMALQLFKGEAKNGKNAALKQYAEQTLPSLENHLKMTQDLLGKTQGSEKKAVGQQNPK